MKTINIRQVIDVFKKRINATSIKEYWREEKNEVHNSVDCRGAELTYSNLTGKQVREALEGVPVIENVAFKGQAMKRRVKWELKTPACKFRCTLYVTKVAGGHEMNFTFTSDF